MRPWYSRRIRDGADPDRFNPEADLRLTTDLFEYVVVVSVEAAVSNVVVLIVVWGVWNRLLSAGSLSRELSPVVNGIVGNEIREDSKSSVHSSLSFVDWRTDGSIIVVESSMDWEAVRRVDELWVGMVQYGEGAEEDMFFWYVR